jgi:hypothetical protein
MTASWLPFFAESPRAPEFMHNRLAKLSVRRTLSPDVLRQTRSAEVVIGAWDF